MKRRAFVFTLDAVLALLLVLMFVVSISAVSENASHVYQTQFQLQNKVIAQNVLNVLQTVPLSDLVPSTTIKQWISTGVLNLTYVNPQMSSLQIVSTYWALNSTECRHNAETIINYLLGRLITGYNYQLIINNYTSPYLTFNNSYQKANNIGTATIFVSGYSSNETPRGYVAKAYLTKMVTAQEKLVGIQRILAGGYYGLECGLLSCWYTKENSLNVGFNVALPDDANVTEGILNLVTRSGENVDFKINGTTVTHTGTRALNVTRYFSGGITPISAYFYNPQGYEMGFGSGSWISLKYTTSTPEVENPGLIKLYNVTSQGTGIYYLNSIFVPGEVEGINIKLTVQGVHKIRVYYSNGTALNLIYENRSVFPGLATVVIPNSTLVGNLTRYISLQDLSRKNFNLVIMLDAYYNSSYSRPVRYAGQDYNYNWDNKRILYGYPYSYINITYTPKVKLTRFMIPIEQTYSLNGKNPVYWLSRWGQYLAGYKTMYFDYYLPDKATPWYVDVWTAIHFLGYPSGTIKLYEGPNAKTEVFLIPLDYYLIRVAYTRLNDNIMVPGDVNEFKLESDSNDYIFRVNDSRSIVHYFLKGYAPYGNTFTYYSQDNACGYNLTYWYDLAGRVTEGTVLIGNCPPSESPKSLTTYDLKPWKYALDNAIYRLFIQLGAREYSIAQIKSNNKFIPGTEENPIRIQLKGLAGKAIGIKNVPNSGKGIQVTLRIWRGG